MDVEDYPQGPRPLNRGLRVSIAMLVSLVLHVWLVVLLTRAWLHESAPAAVSAPPTIELALVTPDAAEESEQDRPHTPHPEAVLQPLPQTDRRHTPGEHIVETVSEPPSVPEQPRTQRVARESDRAQDDRVHLADRPLAEPVLSIVGPREPQPPPRPVETAAVQLPAPTQPLRPDQKQMLEKKLRRWSWNIRKLARADDKVSWKRGGQAYSATITHLPARNATDFDRAVVEISTEIDGVRWSTEVRLRRLAFSSFAQLIDRWDPSVSFSADIVEGRFHSNSKIVVALDRKVETRFEGKVTVASTVEFDGFGRRSAVFPAGLETRVRKIRLPRNNLAAEALERYQPENVHYFDRDTDLLFLPGGRVVCSAIEASRPPFGLDLAGPANYLLAVEGVTLSVRGIVNGAVIVYSPRGITIAGDVRYSRDPETFPESQDFIGLISERSIEVAGPDVTGPGDLTIQAAIYAGRRFAVRSYRDRNRGLMTIYGSVTAGSLTATEPRYGTRLRFDRRLESIRPPGFPMTDRYEIDSWDRVWREKPKG